MLLSIIIVNFKSARLISDCLQTVFRQTGSGDFEVIIVDNNSGDDSKQNILGAYPGVRWLQMNYNAGFARANNAGIRDAKGELILLLNPDTLIEGNAITECAARLQASECIAASAQLLNADGSPQITGNYFMTGGLNHLMVLPYTGRLLRWIGYRLKVKSTNVANASGTVEVDWINGAFLMVKKEAIEKAGPLDEDFFLYSEEIEWCSRLRKTGKLCVYGDLHVIHLQGETANSAFGDTQKGYTNLADRKGLQVMLSGFVRVRKQFGAGWFLFHLAAYLFTIPVYFLVVLLSSPFAGSAFKVQWKAWLGFTANILRCCRYFFTLLANKPHFYKVI